MITQPQQPPQLNRIQQMNNMMRNVRRDDGLSNLMALQQMRQMRQPQMMPQQPPQTMTYMAQGGLTSLPVQHMFLGSLAKKVKRGAQRLGGAAKDVVDSGLSGIKSALGGGKGIGDFFKTLALMAITNMLIPGGGPLMTAAKAYVVPSLATGGLNELTSDPFREDKMIRAGVAGLGHWGADKYKAHQAAKMGPDPVVDSSSAPSHAQYANVEPPPPVTTTVPTDVAVDGGKFLADASGNIQGAPGMESFSGNNYGLDTRNIFEKGVDTAGNVIDKAGGYIDKAGGYIDTAGGYVDTAMDTAKDFLGKEIGPRGYDVAQLGKDAVTAYGTTEIKKEMDASKKAQQDAQGLANQIQREAEAKKMTAQQFAKAAIEDPVKYSYIYKYGANPQSVQDILERMYQGTEDTQTAQYFEPATYTTESGRLPGELAAATGGGISSIINNATGQNQQFFEGQVPNTTRDNSDGMSDNETMLITDETGKKPKGIMKISEKEYVVSAPDMAILGNGDPNAGAQALDEFREGLRKAAYGTKAHQPRLNPRTALQSLANKAFG